MPAPNPNPRLVYKVASRELWSDAQSAGQFIGAPIDKKDGYIHFSTATQLPETLAKHFAGQANLLLIAVQADLLGPDLRWEPSRGGDLFPHLYKPLPCDAIVWTRELELDNDRQHVLPDNLSSESDS